VSTDAAMPDPAPSAHLPTPVGPTSMGRYHRAATPPPLGREAPRASVGEVCRTLAAIGAATRRARDMTRDNARDGATSRRGAPPPSAGQQRDELARLRAEARAAVTGLVLRLRADDVPLDRVLAVVRGAARDALPGSLTPIELRAIAGDAVRWASEAYWADD
jgi:hypothetical protein